MPISTCFFHLKLPLATFSRNNVKLTGRKAALGTKHMAKTPPLLTVQKQGIENSPVLHFFLLNFKFILFQITSAVLSYPMLYDFHFRNVHCINKSIQLNYRHFATKNSNFPLVLWKNGKGITLSICPIHIMLAASKSQNLLLVQRHLQTK